MGYLQRLQRAIYGLITSTATSITSAYHTPNDENTKEIQNGKFKLPAESDRHEATILGFPSRSSLPLDQYDAVCGELIQLAAAIAEFEPVRLYARPEDMELAGALVKATVNQISRITVIPCPINHCWVRDTGPLFVRDATGAFPKRRFAIDFRFDEWGGKKPKDEGVAWGQQWPLMDDKTLQENTDFARYVIDHDRNPAPVTRIDAPIRAEGGGLVVDGDGTLLITESSIVCNIRNPGMTKGDIEEQLKRLLGVEKVVWFPGRPNVDITDVHMDAEARFIRPGVIVYSKPHDMALDIWKELSTEIREILGRETDAKGRSLEIHTIEEPDPCGLGKSVDDELAASYVNFYFVNGGLIIPKFGDEQRDQKALEILQALLPQRVVKQVYTNAIPLTGGALHCVTQQVPAPEAWR
jgi:agmatine deiminase